MKFFTPAQVPLDNIITQLDTICSSDFIVNLPTEPMNVIIAFRDKLRVCPYECSVECLNKVIVAQQDLYKWRLDSEGNAIQGNSALDEVMNALSLCSDALTRWSSKQAEQS